MLISIPLFPCFQFYGAKLSKYDSFKSKGLQYPLLFYRSSASNRCKYFQMESSYLDAQLWKRSCLHGFHWKFPPSPGNDDGSLIQPKWYLFALVLKRPHSRETDCIPLEVPERRTYFLGRTGIYRLFTKTTSKNSLKLSHCLQTVHF